MTRLVCALLLLPAQGMMLCFASSSNANDNNTNNNDYNSCTQPMVTMSNSVRRHTTTTPHHNTPHTKKNTHEPRARGALAMAPGVPYISSTSGSNMGCIAARLHIAARIANRQGML